MRSEHAGRIYYGAVEYAALEEMDIDRHRLVKEAANAARKWLGRKLGGEGQASIIFCGPPGVGKTHIARAIYWGHQVYADEPEPASYSFAKWFWAPDLLLKLDNEIHLDNMLGYVPDKAPEWIKEKACPTFVIDDIGAETRIPYVAAQDQAAEAAARFHLIVDWCHTNERSLIITTNLRPRGLELFVGPRTWSRLREMAPPGFIVDMTGVPDYRRQAEEV